jgi:hypothetical protein
MPTGRYQLRVGARDPQTGNSGTVFYDVTVPDFSREPLMMSGLLIAGAPEVLTPQRDQAAEKILGGAPGATRVFPRGDTVAWLAEIYDNSTARGARQIDVSSRLLDQTGREAFAARDTLTNGEGGGKDWTTFAYRGRIPLRDLAPGRYLLRVDVRDRAASTTDRPVYAESVVTIQSVDVMRLQAVVLAV